MVIQWTKVSLGSNAWVNVSSFYGKKKKSRLGSQVLMSPFVLHLASSLFESTFQLTKENVLCYCFVFPANEKQKLDPVISWYTRFPAAQDLENPKKGHTFDSPGSQDFVLVPFS